MPCALCFVPSYAHESGEGTGFQRLHSLWPGGSGQRQFYLWPQVIIAGAGGAAHLPGMVAALTPLPVIGVPVKPTGAHLDGLDALLSIVQACPRCASC